jgi:hypothetical protein
MTPTDANNREVPTGVTALRRMDAAGHRERRFHLNALMIGTSPHRLVACTSNARDRAGRDAISTALPHPRNKRETALRAIASSNLLTQKNRLLG